MPESDLIFAKQLDGNGGCSNHATAAELQNSEQPVWLHFDANHSNIRESIINAAPDVDQHTLDAILTVDARPRVLELERGILVILRGINHNEGGEPEDMIGIRLWVTAKRLISLRFRKSKAVMNVAQALDDNKGPLTTGGILAHICTLLINYIEISVGEMEDVMDGLETDILAKPEKGLRHAISDIRISAIMLRRHIAPQRDALGQLRVIKNDWLNKNAMRRLQESYDAQLRVLENLDAIRERSQVVTDELASSLSDKLNRNLYVLSVITAIFLPLGFLTGLFGINIGGMPGVDNDDAFKLFVSVLLGITAIQVVLFKWFKWF